MRKWLALLAVAFVTSTGIAAWLLVELHAERTRSHELALQLDREMRSNPPAAKSGVDSPAPAATPNASPAPDRGSTDPANERVVRVTDEDEEAAEARLMRNPAYRDARRAQQRLAYAPRRGMLIQLLGFTPSQADSAIDLQLDQEARLNEFDRGASVTEDTHAEFSARREALQREQQNQLRELLGEDKRSRLASYMESRGTRMQVDNFRGELNESNALRDDQVEPLIAALHVERSKMIADMREYQDAEMAKPTGDGSWVKNTLEKQTELLKTMNAGMHAAAATLLTGSQLDALDAMLKRDLDRMEATQRLNAIQLNLERATQSAAANN